MAGNDNGFGRQLLKLLHARHQGLHVAAGEIRAADGTREERIAREEGFRLGEMIANAARRMTGRIDDLRMQGKRRRFRGISEVLYAHGRIVGRQAVQGMGHHLRVLLRHIDGQFGIGLLKFGDGADVVEVSVREENRLGKEMMFGKCGEDALRLLAGIDDQRLPPLGE